MRVPDRLVLGTKNPDKVVEMRAVFARAAPQIEVVADAAWPDVDETGETLEENALLKARAVVAVTGIAAVADDTGLEVDALDGAPGVFSARFAGPDATYADNRVRLLERLGDREDRTARFRTVIALVDADGGSATVEGVLEGRITRFPRGEGGFGYDPVFEVDGRTLAEIPAGEKNRISHRARALEALVDALTGPDSSA